MSKIISTAEGIASGFFAVPILAAAAFLAGGAVYLGWTYGSAAWRWVYDRQGPIDVGIGVAAFFAVAILGALIVAKVYD